MRNRRARSALAAGALLLASTLGGCTLVQGQQLEIDPVAGGYHVHLYRSTTLWVWALHALTCHWDPACTLGKVEQQARGNGLVAAVAGLDLFFDDDVADFDEALRSTPHPWPLSVNLPEQYGCLGGYKNLVVPRADGDWYGDPPAAPWCLVGQAPR